MGSSAGIPNISVRLTADGVQDVINAFARVRDEGKTTGTQTAASLNLITSQIESLTSLLPSLTAGAALTGLVSLGVNAFETAENLEKLSLKTGISVGDLSVLQIAAKETGTDMDSLATGIVKLTKDAADGANGSEKQAKALKDLGLSMADVNKSSPYDLFIKVATAGNAMGNVFTRNQAIIALFGRAGAELIPVLDNIGSQGIAALQEKAERFGVYVGGQFGEDAKAAKASIADLEMIAEGASLEFVSGLLPAVTGVANALADMAGGADGFKTWGQVVGIAVLNVAKQVVDLTADIQLGLTMFRSFEGSGIAQIAKLALEMNPIVGMGKAIAGYAVSSAADDAQTNMKVTAIMANQIKAQKAIDDAMAALQKTGAEGAGPSAHGGAPGTGMTQQEMDKIAAARSAYLQSLADNELTILKAKNTIAEAEDKRHYDAGLITLDQYYDAREARIKAEADAELEALSNKQQAVTAMPETTQEQRYKKLEEDAKVETAITQAQIKEQGDLQAAEDARSADKHANALKELEDIEKLQEATGDAAGAAETKLTIETQKYSDLLQKQQDLTDAQKQDKVDAFTVAGHAKNGFNENAAEANRLMQSMDQQIGSIQDQASNGTISEVAAQAQILDLETKQLAILQPLLAVMKEQADASPDKALIGTWNQMNAAVQKVAMSMKNVQTAQTYLVNTLATTGRTDFEDFFTSIGDGQKSASKAFDDLATDFEEMVSRMISKLLIYYALEALVGWIAPTAGAGFLKTLTASGPFGKFDGGGWTGGKAGQVTGLVHGEEFVVKAGPAAAFRPFLEALNAGETPAIMPLHSAVSVASNYANEVSNAESTATGPAASAALPAIINITNNTGQQIQQTQRQGTGGQSITDIIIGVVNKDIVSGGQTAKTLQNQYGLSRQGTRKG